MPELPTGRAIGELSDDVHADFQVDDVIDSWVCVSNKSYAYRLRETKMTKYKYKGVTLGLNINVEKDQDVSYKTMVDMVTNNPDSCCLLYTSPSPRDA